MLGKRSRIRRAARLRKRRKYRIQRKRMQISLTGQKPAQKSRVI